jgi:anti-anti-sigma regulatory factor
MLRIEIRQGTDKTVFVLEGKLVGRWVDEFDRCWKDAAVQPSGKITVDLSGVSFIDSKGREVLAELRRLGATLLASGCHTKAVLRDIEAEMNGQNSSTGDCRH